MRVIVRKGDGRLSHFEFAPGLIYRLDDKFSIADNTARHLSHWFRQKSQIFQAIARNAIFGTLSLRKTEFWNVFVEKRE
jgi:hypothetical protein